MMNFLCRYGNYIQFLAKKFINDPPPHPHGSARMRKIIFLIRSEIFIHLIAKNLLLEIDPPLHGMDSWQTGLFMCRYRYFVQFLANTIFSLTLAPTSPPWSEGLET